MANPELELQDAIVRALKAESLTVYDSVPANAAFPYVSIGPVTSVQDDADCIDGMEITIQVDVWSRAVGVGEAGRITDTVRRALHRAEFELTENALVMIEHTNSRRLRDPDGLTLHAVIEFRALVETP
jgi:hypothetical protein